MCIYVLYSTVDIDVQVCLRKRAQASEIRRRFFSHKNRACMAIWLRDQETRNKIKFFKGRV